MTSSEHAVLSCVSIDNSKSESDSGSLSKSEKASIPYFSDSISNLSTLIHQDFEGKGVTGRNSQFAFEAYLTFRTNPECLLMLVSVLCVFVRLRRDISQYT